MMNSNSLYVSTMKLALTATPEDPASLTDLCRLMPYLRQSLSCTVCGNLLVDPYTPQDTNCQHHVCNACKGGKKKLKPTCSWCKDYDNYDENVPLRSLLQCYKKMCDYLIISPLYRLMSSSTGESNITDLIDEGSSFKDEFKCNAGLSKSAYSILPCIYTHTSTQTTIPNSSLGESYGEDGQPGKQNGSPLYSIMYGSGNKMVFKRKLHDDQQLMMKGNNNFKRPVHRRSGKSKSSRAGKEDEKKNGKNPDKKPRIGCRCGNATVTPGKLTCCGQRCPCYVGSKACLDCKCRGCRNPHTREGQKVLREMQEMRKNSQSDEELESEMLEIGLDVDDLQLDQVLELRSGTSHNDLDLL